MNTPYSVYTPGDGKHNGQNITKGAKNLMSLFSNVPKDVKNFDL